MVTVTVTVIDTVIESMGTEVTIHGGVWMVTVTMTRVYFRKLDKGGANCTYKKSWGGNMKTHQAVYEEGLFDLRGGKTLWGGGANGPPHPSLKKP